MERDFMGLNTKDSLVVIKEEPVEGCKSSAFFKGSPIQWPLSNKFDPSSKHQTAEIQKIINQNRQGGTHFSMTAYPVQQNVHLPRDINIHPGSNQAVSAAMNSPFFKTHFGGAAQNYAGGTMKHQLLGGIPVTTSVIPPCGSVSGTTEQWFSSKASNGPAQLTIFYGGTVNVFDAISPEKAQAIMLLAGNACSVASNMAQPRTHVQASAPKLAAEDGVYGNQRMNTPPSSALSSPLSVSSHPVGQSGGLSTNNDGPKTTGGSTDPVSHKVDAPKSLTSMGHVAATTMITSAVPQARKASLARFLEKRKERAMNSAPYNQVKEFGECLAPGSNGISFSASSAAGSVCMTITKERRL